MTALLEELARCFGLSGPSRPVLLIRSPIEVRLIAVMDRRVRRSAFVQATRSKNPRFDANPVLMNAHLWGEPDVVI